MGAPAPLRKDNMKMGVPYVGFGNKTLRKQPKVHAGDVFICPMCSLPHVLKACTDKDGNTSELLLFYKCNEKDYLGAVNNRLVAGVKADASGKV